MKDSFVGSHVKVYACVHGALHRETLFRCTAVFQSFSSPLICVHELIFFFFWLFIAGSITFISRVLHSSLLTCGILIVKHLRGDH